MLDLLLALDAVRQWRDDLTADEPVERRRRPVRRRSPLRLVYAPVTRLLAGIAQRPRMTTEPGRVCSDGAAR